MITTGAFTASTRPPRVECDCLVVVTDEVRPVLLICSCHDRCCEAIAFQRDGNSKIEIVILHDLMIFEN